MFVDLSQSEVWALAWFVSTQAAASVDSRVSYVQNVHRLEKIPVTMTLMKYMCIFFYVTMQKTNKIMPFLSLAKQKV